MTLACNSIFRAVMNFGWFNAMVKLRPYSRCEVLR
ncbi:hypothetical protein ABIF38_000306 [Bradyrhizobium japonicum]|nr:hypothetical protein [Bradyrhizobium elkanii]MCP1737629.1 hypothetical protein [Bradyrhizobium elkanii]MCS3576186.1 hypothetical protein [Bradyrhizobium elkanii]MCS3594479.1 hypothetical protein [Bradyrhizobium elkanii]MCS3626068.1 hypothetical protein [Bradyrhizobium elkanii]